MSKFETVDYAIDAGVALITLNRPQSMNAFNRRMRGDVFEAVRLASADPQVRVAVLTGAGLSLIHI